MLNDAVDKDWRECPFREDADNWDVFRSTFSFAKTQYDRILVVLGGSASYWGLGDEFHKWQTYAMSILISLNIAVVDGMMLLKSCTKSLDGFHLDASDIQQQPNAVKIAKFCRDCVNYLSFTCKRIDATDRKTEMDHVFQSGIRKQDHLTDSNRIRKSDNTFTDSSPAKNCSPEVLKRQTLLSEQKIKDTLNSIFTGFDLPTYHLEVVRQTRRNVAAYGNDGHILTVSEMAMAGGSSKPLDTPSFDFVVGLCRYRGHLLGMDLNKKGWFPIVQILEELSFHSGEIIYKS